MHIDIHVFTYTKQNCTWLDDSLHSLDSFRFEKGSLFWCSSTMLHFPHRVILSTLPEFRLPFFLRFYLILYFFLHSFMVLLFMYCSLLQKKSQCCKKNSRIWTGEKLWTNSRAKWFNIEFLKYFCWAVQFSSFILTVSNCFLTLGKEEVIILYIQRRFSFLLYLSFCSAYVKWYLQKVFNLHYHN